MRNLAQRINRPQALKALMEDVLTLAKKAGASNAAVSVNHDEGFCVDVRMGETETVTFNEDQGVSVTVYLGQSKGSATSSDTSPNALLQMVSHAIDIAKVSAEDPCFGLPEVAEIKKEYPVLDLYHPWEITPDEAQQLAIDCEAKARAQDKRIHNSDGASVSTYRFCRGYANTHDFMGVVESTRHGMSCSLLAQEGTGEMQRDYAYTTARNAKDLMSTSELASLAATRTIERLSPRKLKTQKVPVIFSSRVSSGLFGAFAQAISGSNLYKKNSFLLDSLEQQIFPENINIFEAPHEFSALGSAPFDAEGIVTRSNQFIKDGVLQQYILGSYSARKLGLKTTANAGGVHNLTVTPTASDLSDMLHDMGTGLLVTELMGQGVNGITGDYSRGASGFWVEDGEIQYPVDGITIAGNLKNMFLNILGVGTDINPSIATRCGSVWLEEMMIAGT